MNSKPSTNWTRRTLQTIIVIFSGWLVYDGAMNLIAWHFLRETCRENANLSVVPIPLPDQHIAPLNKMRINAFEYSLQIPWSDLDTERDGKSIAIRYFKCGATLMLFDPMSEIDSVKLIQGVTEQDAKKMISIFGARALSSNYDLVAAELSASPSQVKWWSTRTAKARALVLLNLKSMEMLDSKVIYPQSSEEMHGFQFGNPALPPYKVELDLYDRNDRRYRLWVAGKNLNHPILTQAELNAMVASLKPIPHS
jgi:hypothetical protein